MSDSLIALFERAPDVVSRRFDVCETITRRRALPDPDPGFDRDPSEEEGSDG
jgi:hypothetical protein